MLFCYEWHIEDVAHIYWHIFFKVSGTGKIQTMPEPLWFESESFSREAVVTAEQVDVLSGPGENYLLEFTVPEGMALAIEEERGDCWRVRLGGDREGRAQRAGLQEIKGPYLESEAIYR